MTPVTFAAATNAASTHDNDDDKNNGMRGMR
jgi:hypothetical protein